MENSTFALEKYALLNLNYLENMVDANNQPYFNIFWTSPVSAIHDWPDVCDVAVRQLQAAVMIRHMTGKAAKNEAKYFDNFLSRFQHDDGLAYRPSTPYTLHAANVDEQTLALTTLVTLMQDGNSDKIEELIIKAIDSYYKIGVSQDNAFWFPAFDYFPDGWKRKILEKPGSDHYMMLTRPLMQFYKLTGYEKAFQLAEKIINGVLNRSNYINEDDTFSGHVHGHLSFLSGVTDYASVVDDNQLLEKMNRLYLFIKSQSTNFGWIPEVTGRESDCIGCETCGIMDFIHLGIMLAKNGYTQYWDDIERAARNHLVESQFSDTDWMKSDESKPDTNEISYRNIYSRMKGGFAGWSSPIHYLAYLEYLPDGWLQNTSNTVINKYRIAQNCCGGSGSRALFHVWSNVLELKGDTLILNMHFDKKTADAEVRCYKPYFGKTQISVNSDLRLKVRIPEFLKKEDIRCKINDEFYEFETEDNYMITKKVGKGSVIDFEYPLPEKKETISIGNTRFQKYFYDVFWKGDTVIKIIPHDNPIEGYSHVNKSRVKIFSGEPGPGRLYQRDNLYVSKVMPVPYPLIQDMRKIFF